MTGLPSCPTPCDDDCELHPDGCHESHQVPSHRGHQPHGCEEIRRAIAAAVAAERERIARLSEEHMAFYVTEREIHPGAGAEPVAMGFADVIREQR